MSFGIAILAVFPIIAAIVYLSQAMRLTTEENKSTKRDRDQAEWELRQDIKRQRETAKIESKYKDQRHVELPVLWEQGMSKGQIAQKFNVTVKTVERDIKTLNLNGRE